MDKVFAATKGALGRWFVPVSDRPYPKWVGVILGLVLSGSAHFLSGRKREGLAWYFSLLAFGLLGVGLIVLPQSRAFYGALAIWLCSVGLRLVMLVQSYRPVRRIGWHGWLVLIVAVMCLNTAVKSMTRLVVHPFSISAGSMEPTLCGVRVEEVKDGARPHAGLLGRLLGGRRAVHWEAAASGALTGPHYDPQAVPLWGYQVGQDVRWLPRSVKLRFTAGQRISRGDLLWSGFVIAGDRVMVEKLTYRWRAPRRGEIVVFRTDGIKDLAAGEFWMKRVVGLPGERVSIDPPHLVIDGRRVVDPPIFERITSQSDGYQGFQWAGDSQCHAFLDTAKSEVVLGPDEYLVLGDNAANSSDSRNWGPVLRENIIGRVTRIYWPLDRVDALEGKW